MDRLDSVDKFKLTSPSGTHIFSEVKIRSAMSCSVVLRKDWSWDAGSPETTIGSSADPVPYFEDQATSYRVNGCEDVTVTVYENRGYEGASEVLRGTSNTNLKVIPDDRLSSIKFATIATSIPDTLSPVDLDDCPGATKKYEKSGGKKYRCFYSNTDVNELKTLKRDADNQEQSSAWTKLIKQFCGKNDRIITESACGKGEIADDMYIELAEAFCKSAAGQSNKWCACYNLKNKACDTNSNAAGCEYHKVLEENRGAFGPEPDIPDPNDSTKKIKGYSDGYKILKDNAHCRARACNPEFHYVPANVKSDCQPSYNFCEKDINIQSMSNNDIVIECNGPNFGTLPDWWDEGGDPDFWKEKRCPPFDKSPLNKLPITCFPKKFKWKNKNVRYLTYSGLSSISSCCLCMLIIMSSLKRR